MHYVFVLILSIVMLFSCKQGSGGGEAALTGAGPSREQLLPELEENAPGISGANAYNHVSALVSMGPRPPGSTALEKSVAFMEDQLARYGWSTKRQTFTEQTVAGLVRFTNLRARLGPGADFSSPARGIIGCHIDTKVFPFHFVGANDGASHMAVVLELARVMAREPDRWQQVELVFFDGEESFNETMDPEKDGLYGSRYFVSQLNDHLPAWMVNLDMLGARKLRIAIPQDTPPGMYALYRRTMRELGESEEVFGVAAGYIWDDHYPFQSKGVEVINFIADFHTGDWWHTEKDNLDLISPVSLERSGKFILAFLQALCPVKSSE